METVPLVTTDSVRSFLRGLPSISAAADSAERIERLRLFEELKGAISAAQALEAVGLDRSRRAEHAAAGLPPDKHGAGVAGEIGLAMRVSPHRAQRWLGWAKTITRELPATFHELQAGRTSEWRTMLVARETAVLSREDRATVDAQLASRFEGWGDKRIGDEARKSAYRLDPKAAVERARRAEKDRHVAVRPVPDTMCRLTGLLPVAQGVAAFASLRRDADAIAGHGDETRSRSQVMADLLVERLTGQKAAGDVSVEIELVMTDQALIGFGDGADEPAHLVGFGPVPAGLARDLALNSDDGEGKRWLRRLYTRPVDGQLVAMESRRRLFTTAQQRFLRVRDQFCRMPFCDAPIRHADHVEKHANGGPTSVANGAGTSETCNHTKEAPGWTTRAGPDGTIETITPTGHRYVSRPPDLPGARLRHDGSVMIDFLWAEAA